jgi:hypothetical protein
LRIAISSMPITFGAGARRLRQQVLLVERLRCRAPSRPAGSLGTHACPTGAASDSPQPSSKSHPVPSVAMRARNPATMRFSDALTLGLTRTTSRRPMKKMALLEPPQLRLSEGKQV